MTRKNRQRFGKRRVYFSARWWTISMLDAVDPDDQDRLRNQGSINENRGRIEVVYMNRDQAILTMLHEIEHHAMPDADEAQILRAEVVLKDALEAMGVDLSPMLDGYE